MRKTIMIMFFYFLGYTAGRDVQMVWAQQTIKKTLAVLPLTPTGVAPTETSALTDQLLVDLVQTKSFTVIERARVEEILKEQNLGQTGCVTVECVAEAGKLLGAQIMVAGSVGKVGQTYNITARLIDVETGQVMLSRNISYRGEIDGLLTKMREMAEALVSSTSTPTPVPPTTNFVMPLPTTLTDLYVKSGDKLASEGRWKEAETEYRKVISLEPNNAQWYSNLGTILQQQQRWAEAEKMYREAMRLDPDNMQWNIDLEMILRRQQKWAEVEKLSKETLQKWAETEKKYREATQREPKNVQWYVDWGEALLKQKKWTEAEEVYRKVIQLEPNNAPWHSRLGDVLRMQQKNAAAESEYREAVRLEPDNVQWLANVGIALYYQQKWLEAEFAFQQVVRLDPTNTVYQDYLKQVLRIQKTLQK